MGTENEGRGRGRDRKKGRGEGENRHTNPSLLPAPLISNANVGSWL